MQLSESEGKSAQSLRVRRGLGLSILLLSAAEQAGTKQTYLGLLHLLLEACALPNMRKVPVPPLVLLAAVVYCRASVTEQRISEFSAAQLALNRTFSVAWLHRYEAGQIYQTPCMLAAR